MQGSWPERPGFSYQRDLHLFGLLPADNKLIMKAGTFFNTTEVPIHIEPTPNFVYQYELVTGK
jgi:hypothetical protein